VGMLPRKISQLEGGGTPSGTALIEVSEPSGSSFKSVKVLISALGTAIGAMLTSATNATAAALQNLATRSTTDPLVFNHAVEASYFVTDGSNETLIYGQAGGTNSIATGGSGMSFSVAAGEFLDYNATTPDTVTTAYAVSMLSLTLSDGTNLFTSTVAMANGAGADVGTLTNAPAAGNPTKWIAIDDNGTTRYIPAW